MAVAFDPASGTDPGSVDPDLDHVIDNASIDTDPRRPIDVAHPRPTNASADLDPKKEPSPCPTHNLANFSSSHFFDGKSIICVNALLW